MADVMGEGFGAQDFGGGNVWKDKFTNFMTRASGSLEKDPGTWSQILGQLAPLVAPENQLVKGMGAIGTQLGKGKTLMTAEQAKAAKDEEFKKNILAAMGGMSTVDGDAGMTKLERFANKGGGDSYKATFDLEDNPVIDPTTGQPMQNAQAGTIANNTGGISLDQGPVASPGVDQITRKGFDIRPFFQP